YAAAIPDWAVPPSEPPVVPPVVPVDCVVEASASSTAATAAAEEVPAGGDSPGTGVWKLARGAVDVVCSRSAALVWGPRTPSTARPLLAWSFWTASSVSGRTRRRL